MKKSPKPPRTFGRTKAKARPQKKQEPRSSRMEDWQVAGLGSVFPGFAEWYRQSYDEQGKYIGARIPGLLG